MAMITLKLLGIVGAIQNSLSPGFFSGRNLRSECYGNSGSSKTYQAEHKDQLGIELGLSCTANFITMKINKVTIFPRTI